MSKKAKTVMLFFIPIKGSNCLGARWSSLSPLLVWSMRWSSRDQPSSSTRTGELLTEESALSVSWLVWSMKWNNRDQQSSSTRTGELLTVELALSASVEIILERIHMNVMLCLCPLVFVDS